MLDHIVISYIIDAMILYQDEVKNSRIAFSLQNTFIY